jgi:hypothetical protein
VPRQRSPGRTFAALPCLFVLGSLVTLVACGGESEQGEPVVIPEPADAVRRFDPGQPEASLDRLNRASFAEPSSIRSLGPFIQDADPDRRWAAIYLAALLVTEERAEVLRPALADEDPSLRVMAAGGLARLGVIESVPVLIEGLRSEEALPYSDPPRPTAELALEALTAYTDRSFDDPAEWERWWTEVEGSVRWDGERYVEG